MLRFWMIQMLWKPFKRKYPLTTRTTTSMWHVYDFGIVKMKIFCLLGMLSIIFQLLFMAFAKSQNCIEKRYKRIERGIICFYLYFIIINSVWLTFFDVCYRRISVPKAWVFWHAYLFKWSFWSCPYQFEIICNLGSFTPFLA